MFMCGAYHSLTSLLQFHHHWPFSLEVLPKTAYLVGGAVRDVLLNRQAEHLDLDFVLPHDAIPVASQIARYYNAGFVLLDEERQIARVVFPEATADFAQQVGPTLETDLLRRDFTVNAIAYNPHTQTLYDPLKGYQDLQRGLLKMVSALNLEEDPLRLLRAYRQAAQLNFSLESDTQASIRHLAPHLQAVAAERVQAELRYLLCADQGLEWVTIAWQDCLLQDWLKHITSDRILHFQAIYLAEQVLCEAIPEFAQALQVRVHDSTFAPRRCIGNHRVMEVHAERNLRLIAKLASLVAQDCAIAEFELSHLKFSRAEIRAVSILLRNYPALKTLSQPLSLQAQYLLFQDLGGIFPAFAIFARGAGISMDVILPLVQRFLNPNDAVAHPQSLVTGKDVMEALRLSPGPIIGQLLAEIQLAHAEGKITTAEQAIEFSRQKMKTLKDTEDNPTSAVGSQDIQPSERGSREDSAE